MGFETFVQVGRAVVIVSGPEKGKLGVIVEIISEKSALIDGPKDGASRQVIQLSHLYLLPVVIPKFPRGARSSTVAKKLAASDIEKKFEASRLAKKAAVREKRANLSDFDRFKVQRLKKQRAFEVRKTVGKASKA